MQQVKSRLLWSRYSGREETRKGLKPLDQNSPKEQKMNTERRERERERKKNLFWDFFPPKRTSSLSREKLCSWLVKPNMICKEKQGTRWASKGFEKQKSLLKAYQVSIQPIQAVSGVGIMIRFGVLRTDKLHDLMFSFTRCLEKKQKLRRQFKPLLSLTFKQQPKRTSWPDKKTLTFCHSLSVDTLLWTKYLSCSCSLAIKSVPGKSLEEKIVQPREIGKNRTRQKSLNKSKLRQRVRRSLLFFT